MRRGISAWEISLHGEVISAVIRGFVPSHAQGKQ